MPSNRKKARRSRARHSDQVPRKLRDLAYKRSETHDSPNNHRLEALDASDEAYANPSHTQSYLRSTTGTYATNMQVPLRSDDSDELEFNRKIAEARVYLHSTCNSSGLVCPNNSPSELTTSPASIATPPPLDHYAPVIAVSPASLKDVKPQLKYALGIGIAMTEHEHSLLDTLLPGCAESGNIQKSTLDEPTPTKSWNESNTHEVHNLSYAGFAIRYDVSDAEEET